MDQNQDNDENNIIADGSSKSIISCSKREKKTEILNNWIAEFLVVKKDKDKKKAFQAIVSKFVLSYVNEAQATNTDNFDKKLSETFKKNEENWRDY